MTGRNTTTEKVAAWYLAYEAISDQLTKRSMREYVAGIVVDSSDKRDRADKLAGVIHANDRIAAIAAAIIVSTGVRPIPVSVEDDGDGFGLT